MPIWAQNLMVTGKGYQFRLRRTSDSLIERHLSLLLKSQWWSEEQFAEYRDARFRDLIAVALKDVPHYRGLAKREGFTAADFNGVADVTRLPMLAKTDLRGRESEFCNETVPHGRRIILNTSGTTGTPLAMTETQETVSRRVAYVARLRSWIGVSNPLHPRRAQFTGRTIVPSTQSPDRHVYWRHNRADHSLLLSSYHISPKTAGHYIDALRRHQPELVDGYPSCLLALAQCAGGRITGLDRIRGVITTSETVTADDRRLIETAFGARVHDQYAASEPSCFWGECEHGVMHESPEYGITEILDVNGNEVGPGEEGEAVVTSFLNDAMPLIRYRTADLVVRGPDAPCDCGRRLRRMDRIIGRIEEMLYFPERGYTQRLDIAFKGLKGIIEAQVIQDALDHLTVLLVVDGNVAPDLPHVLEENIHEKLGMSVGVTCQFVDRIQRGPNGKFKAVITQVRHLYPERGVGTSAQDA
jgi:phenylacetate-CoA ligase